MLNERLGDDYWLYRWYAAQAAAEIRPTAVDTVRHLVAALNAHEEPRVREAAAEAIGRVHPEVPGASEALTRAVQSAFVRQRITIALNAEDRISMVLEALRSRYPGGFSRS
jgi:HEAT repeat protein